MANITFEQDIREDEQNLASSLKHHFDKGNYPDVRDFVIDIVAIINNHKLTDRFMIGSGSSHIWIKRQEEPDRWAIVTDR